MHKVKTALSSLIVVFAPLALPSSALTFASQAQSRGEESVRSLASGFITRILRKDLEGSLGNPIIGLHHPELARESLERDLPKIEALDSKDLIVGHVLFGSNVARVPVQKRTDNSLGTAELGALYIVSEQGEYRPWQLIMTAEDFADAIIMARSDSEREFVIQSETTRYTTDVMRQIARRSDSFLYAGKPEDAKFACTIGLELAKRFGDKTGLCYALRGMGNVRLTLGEYSPARQYYEESLA